MTDTVTPETEAATEAPAPITVPGLPDGVSSGDPRVTRAIELIWREADLLDRKEYEVWQELYTAEAVYVIPIDTSTDDFDDVLNIVYDDRRMRQMRVTRMTEGFAIAAVDAATTVRTVSRFVPRSVSEGPEGTEVRLSAAQVLIAYKRSNYDIWAGELDITVRLGEQSADDRIARKVIRLVDAEAATPASGFLL